MAGIFSTLVKIAKPFVNNVVGPVVSAAGQVISNLDGSIQPYPFVAGRGLFSGIKTLPGFKFSTLDGKRFQALADNDTIDESTTDIMSASKGLTMNEAATALADVARMNVFSNQVPLINFQEAQVERHLSCALQRTWMEPEDGKEVPANLLRYYDHAYFDIVPAIVNNYYFNKLLDEFDYIALADVVVTVDATSDVKTPTHLYYMPYSKETKMYVNSDALKDVTEPSVFDAKNTEYVFNVNNPAFKHSVWTFAKGKDGKLTTTVKITDIEPKISMDKLLSTEFLKSKFAGKSEYGVLPVEKVKELLKSKPEGVKDEDFLDGKSVEDDVLTYGRIICTKDRLTEGERSAVKIRLDLRFSCAKMVQSYAVIGQTSWTENVTIVEKDGNYTIGSEVSDGSKIGSIPVNPDDPNYDGDGKPNGDDGSGDNPKPDDPVKPDDPDGSGKSYIDPITPSTNYTNYTRMRTSRKNK